MNLAELCRERRRAVARPLFPVLMAVLFAADCRARGKGPPPSIAPAPASPPPAAAAVEPPLTPVAADAPDPARQKLHRCVEAVPVELKARLIERKLPGEGKIRIDGVVQNRGTVGWRPEGNWKALTVSLQCAERNAIRWVPSLWSGYRRLESLQPGEKVTISVPIDWTQAMRRAGCACTLTVGDAATNSVPECGPGPKALTISADEIDAALGASELQPAESRLVIQGRPDVEPGDRERVVKLVVDYDLTALASRLEVAVAPPFSIGYVAPVYLVDRQGRRTIPIPVGCPAEYPAAVSLRVSAFSRGDQPDATAQLEVPSNLICPKP